MATFVLVHGHMHGAWCWDRIIPLLEDHGHRAIALDLPGRGSDRTAHVELTLNSFADAAGAVVNSLAEPVVLVGHSAGGIVLSELAERMPEKIARLVYVAAIMVPDGESIFSAFVNRHPMDPAIAIDGDSAFICDDSLGRRRFYNTCSSKDADWAMARLCREPIPPMTNAVRTTQERFGRVPRAFIQTRYDNAVSLKAQQAMCASLPCETVLTMDTDHSPFICRAQEFSSHLDVLGRESSRKIKAA